MGGGVENKGGMAGNAAQNGHSDGKNTVGQSHSPQFCKKRSDIWGGLYIYHSKHAPHPQRAGRAFFVLRRCTAGDLCNAYSKILIK